MSPDELGGKIRLGHLANNGKLKMATLEPSLSHKARRLQISDCRQMKKISVAELNASSMIKPMPKTMCYYAPFIVEDQRR